MQYPPDDPSAARAAAAAALLTALRDVRDAGERLTAANERLQSAAAWTLEAFGDTADAETIRMLPIGGSHRPGKPAVPPPASRHSTDDLAPDAHAPVLMPGGLYVPADVAELLDPTGERRVSPDSVTGDESTLTDWDGDR